MSTDIFRPAYRELTKDERGAVHLIKDLAEGIAEQLECKSLLYTDPRCKALAITKLEEAVMWATKAITAPEAK